MVHDSSLTILLIEDNPGDARYIRELLPNTTELSERGIGRDRERGLLVGQRGTDGDDEPQLLHETRLADGIEQLEDAEPDVVLLDLNLPDSDGLDTLTTLRERDETVPVVVLTGLSDREVGMRALREGAEEYLVKDEVNADLLVRSVYHAIERTAHERERQRYERLIEKSADVNVIVGPDGTFQYLTPSAERVFGYEPEALVGENGFGYIHPDDREAMQEEFATLLENPDYEPTVEFRLEHADGSWIVLQARARNLLDDPMIEGVVVYTTEITERREYERRLERQREQLAALNQLNGVVRDITDAVIEQSTREEIERTVCERLAETDSYLFAWIGEVDATTDTVSVRAQAGAEGYLDDVEITVDPDDERSEGPTGRAFRTGEMQTTQDVQSDPDFEPWRDRAAERGFRSSAAIPITHEDSLYGVLSVYAERPQAFTGPERTVVSHLGEIVGHAIAAIERKRALTSDELVELELRVRDFFEAIGAPVATDEPIAIDEAVPVGDGDYLLYGETSEDGLDALEALTGELDGWDDLDVKNDRFGSVDFELRLSEPPIITTIASAGGSVDEAVIEGGTFRLTIHLPQGSDVRDVIEDVQERFPSTETLARRQITRSTDPSDRITRAWVDELTDRQQAVLRAAYFSGFFEWPRGSSGEEISDSLDISPATFSQHIRAAQNKLFGALFEEVESD